MTEKSAKSNIIVRKAPRCSRAGNSRWNQDPTGGRGAEGNCVREQPVSSHLNAQRETGKASNSTPAYLNGGGARRGFRREIQWLRGRCSDH